MFNRLVQYWRARKAERQQEDFETGYGVVMTDYFHCNATLDQIQAKVSLITDWGEPMTQIENGMIAAWRKLYSLHHNMEEAVTLLNFMAEMDKPGAAIYQEYGREWRMSIRAAALNLGKQINDN